MLKSEFIYNGTMIDDTLSCLNRALSLNYSIHPDDGGRLLFVSKTGERSIFHRHDMWLLFDIESGIDEYHSLTSALEAGAMSEH